jgi:hypothetical protein
MTKNSELVSKAFRLVNGLKEEELKTFPTSVLKQVRGLISRHVKNGNDVWEEPYLILNEIIKEREFNKNSAE